MKNGYGQRIQDSILELSVQRGERISLKRFGELVGNAEVGRKRPYSATGVSSWIQERAEPGLAAFYAMGKVTGKPAYWFPYGVELTTTPVLPLTPVESEGKQKRRRG